MILGDPAYPSLPWLMKPYPENAHTSASQKNFNYRQSRARMVVENAFGRLKGRWRCLLKRLDFKLSNVPSVVASCVVLHNICEMFGDHFLQEWNSPNGPENPSNSCNSSNAHSTDGSSIRNAIMQHLS